MMVKEETSVWCTVHGCVHDRTSDPYGYNDPNPECTKIDWRTLYWRTHKGDDPS